MLGIPLLLDLAILRIQHSPCYFLLPSSCDEQIYAEMHLRQQMAGTTNMVEQFMKQLHQRASFSSLHEYQLLLRAKSNAEGVTPKGISSSHSYSKSYSIWERQERMRRGEKASIISKFDWDKYLYGTWSTIHQYCRTKSFTLTLLMPTFLSTCHWITVWMA